MTLEDIKKFIEESDVVLSSKNIEKLDKEDVDKIVYMDTDSSFIVLDTLLYYYFKQQIPDLTKNDFDFAVRWFTDDKLQETLKISKTELIQIIQEIAGAFETYINEKLLVKFADLWKIPDEYKKFLTYKQEYIFATLYIHSKKNYAYHQIAEKGILDETFDTLNMGKKSDRNPIANKIIQAMFKEAQLEPDLKKIYQKGMMFIRSFQKMLMENPEQAYVPQSLNQKITEYPTKNVVPRGALIYSILFDYEFKPGTKGKLYLVKRFHLAKIPDAQAKFDKIIQIGRKLWKDFGKENLDVLFVPQDEPVPLDVFEIDIKLQVEKAVVDFMNAALSGLGLTWKI